jgi:cyclopropane-fatty-acyl-phospholipid synthase
MKGKNPGASSQAIQHHYDIGNEFYALWLDSTLSYSGAMWKPGNDLETAQLRKIDYHIEQSGAAGAELVLDVGCGWGGLLKRLVKTHKVKKAVGLTLSQAQAEWVSSLNIPNIEVYTESWSEHQPEKLYDSIISIGAFEHFAKLESSGEERIQGYRDFFMRCREWLKPGGRMSIQTFAYGSIRSREDAQRTSGTQFLAKQIFPETDPPTLADIIAASEGVFEIELLRNDRKDYAKTCLEWIARLKARRDEAIKLVGEEVFARYKQYLQLSTIGFDRGYLALYRITFSRID